ncbi:MAG: ATP-binding cassette domain-containing protein, partial [Clostridia bacterium]|nr:ATP-binding cassette domain-containing protein [Clostridia bacterium]
MSSVEARGLTHTYSKGTPFERTAIDSLTFQIPAGDFVGIIGHTGSGKSTLVQHLNGLMKPTAGSVLIGGKDIWAKPDEIRALRFEVGLCFQYPEYQLFEETVYKDIAFGPGNMGLSEQEIDARVREAAALCGVADEL